MTPECCENCKFWKMLNAEWLKGRCCAHPPVVCGPGEYFFPEVLNDQWCGEWRSAESGSAYAQARIEDLKIRLKEVEEKEGTLRVERKK